MVNVRCGGDGSCPTDTPPAERSPNIIAALKLHPTHQNLLILLRW